MVYFTTALFTASLALSASAFPLTPRALDAATSLQNGQDAQSQNAQFATLTASSPCTDDEQACVNGGFAQCTSGTFAVTDCAGGTQCFALPLVNKAGTSITCTTASDAATRIAATGAQGDVTGSGSGSGDASGGASLAAAATTNNAVVIPSETTAAPAAASSTADPADDSAADPAATAAAADPAADPAATAAAADPDATASAADPTATATAADTTADPDATASAADPTATATAADPTADPDATASAADPAATATAADTTADPDATASAADPAATATAADPAASTASSGDFHLQNGEQAQSQNAQFATLTASSPCSEGDQACVGGGFAQCVGGSFVVTGCAGGTQCFALPLVNKAGTSVTCTTADDATSRVAATGAQGGVDGSGAADASAGARALGC